LRRPPPPPLPLPSPLHRAQAQLALLMADEQAGVALVQAADVALAAEETVWEDRATGRARGKRGAARKVA
jgi:hypothetical protein